MFPPIEGPEGRAVLLRDDERLRPGVLAICARHGLAGEFPERLPGGSVPVYGVGERAALKVFPPGEEAYARTEQRALAAVQGKLGIETPELIAAGELEGWSYVLMGRLRGRLLVDAWGELTERDRDRCAEQLGASVRALHSIEAGGLGLGAASPAWRGFLAEQRANAASVQRKRGLSEEWAAQIEGFLDAVMPELEREKKRSLLHTELMREHLFVARASDGGWALSGLFDFEPAMAGAPEYDFASFGVFVSRADAGFLRRALRAYGLREDEMNGEWQKRVMAYAVLHRYSKLRWYLERVPPVRGEKTLDELAAWWWGFDEENSGA